MFDASALAAAREQLNELAARYTTDQTLTPAERSNLAADLKDAARRIDQLERAADAAPLNPAPSNEPQFGQRLPDIGAWSWNDTYGRPAAARAFGEDA